MKFTLTLAAALMLGGLISARAGEPAISPGEDEGLLPVTIAGLDHVYARPGANLSAYDRVMLDPVEVSFSKS